MTIIKSQEKNYMRSQNRSNKKYTIAMV